MTFKDVLYDIRKLTGLQLSGIKKGVEITLLNVDEDKECILLRTNNGKNKSRPISELRTIWEGLTNQPAIRVEGILQGSGSSRNQPETIFANLPYVEWLIIDNKKHIALVDEPSHPFGTLKQMSQVKTLALTERLNKRTSFAGLQLIVVTNDLESTINLLQDKINGVLSTINSDSYLFKSSGKSILILHSGQCSLTSGTYTVLKDIPSSGLPKIFINEEQYYICETDDLHLLIGPL